MPRKSHGFHSFASDIVPEHVHVLPWPPSDRTPPDHGSRHGRIEGAGTDAVFNARNAAPKPGWTLCKTSD